MKKVLSFVLVLSLVLSSFSMAFAGSSTELKTLSDIEGNANQAAIEVNYDLGIVTGNPDGTFQPEKAVTRAEFAAMITRALAIPDSALSGYASTSFKDTTGYTWAVPYLAFCNSKGIMLGDGAGNAMPGKTITVNEAVTMALRAVGYTANSAELTGVWPSNYVTKAQELKLYDDVAKDATGVDKANAAQIIYNTLTVEKVAVNADGKTEKIKDADGNTVSLLTAGLNCTEEKNVILTSGMIEDSLIAAAKYLGQNGNIYRNDDDEIVAFIAQDCIQLVGRFTDTDTFTTTDDEKDYTFAASSFKVTDGGIGTNTHKLVNGESKGNYTTSTGIAKLKDGNSKEYVVSADVSGKTIKKIYSINEWVANNSDQIGTSDLADIKDDHSLLGEDFVEDDNDEIDYTQFQLVGVSSLNDIKADHIVYVFADGDGIRRIEVGTKTVEGVVKNFKKATESVTTKFAIGTDTYRNAAEVENNIAGGDTIAESNVSDEVKVYLDARGYVYDFEDVTKANNFAVVEKVGGNGIDDQVKLMLADGTEKTFSYDNDEADCGKLTAKSVIGYGLDKNGEIVDSNKNYITTTSIVLGSKTTIKKINGAAHLPYSGITSAAVTGNEDQPLTKVTFSDIKNAKIDSNCVVFTIDKNGDYDVTTIDKVEIDEVINGAALLFDENNNGTANLEKVVAMIIPDSMAKSGDKSYAVINEKNKDANDDGDKVWKIVGYKNGTKLVTTTDDDTVLKNAQSSPDYIANNAAGTFATVEVYEVRTDANGVITRADKFGTTHYAVNAIPASPAKEYMVDGFEVDSADKRNSVVAKATGERFTLAENVVIYRVTDDDEYKLYTGEVKKGDYIQLYETDDEDGYEIAVLVRF